MVGEQREAGKGRVKLSTEGELIPSTTLQIRALGAPDCRGDILKLPSRLEGPKTLVSMPLNRQNQPPSGRPSFQNKSTPPFLPLSFRLLHVSHPAP